MKKLLPLLTASLLLTACLILTLSSCSWFREEHEHQYGKWTIVTAPTEKDAGVGEHFCILENCNHSSRAKIPALSDSYTWTIDEVVDPTHAASGKKVYVSVYGTIEVPIMKLAHAFGDWSMTTAATEVAGGEATRVCECGAVETVPVPALTDDSVWTLTVTEATPGNPGKRTYTSVWGTVEYTIGGN